MPDTNCGEVCVEDTVQRPTFAVMRGHKSSREGRGMSAMGQRSPIGQITTQKMQSVHPILSSKEVSALDMGQRSKNAAMWDVSIIPRGEESVLDMEKS